MYLYVPAHNKMRFFKNENMGFSLMDKLETEVLMDT
jgi:hypothetical protein